MFFARRAFTMVRGHHRPHLLRLTLCWLLLFLVSPPVVVIAGRGAGVVITPMDMENQVMPRPMMNSDKANNNNKSMKKVMRLRKHDEDKPSSSASTTDKSPHAPTAQRPTKPTVDVEKPSPTSSPHARSPLRRPTKPTTAPTKPTTPTRPTATTTDGPATAPPPVSAPLPSKPSGGKGDTPVPTSSPAVGTAPVISTPTTDDPPSSSPVTSSTATRPSSMPAPAATTTTTDMPSTASAPTSVVALVQLPNLSFEAQEVSIGDATTTTTSSIEMAVEAAVERFWQEFLSKTYGGAYRSVDLETTTTFGLADDGSGSNPSIYVNVTGTAMFNEPPGPDTNVRADLHEYLVQGDGALALANFLSSSGADITAIGTIALDGEVVVVMGDPIVATPPAPGPVTVVTTSETGVRFPTITFDAAAFNTTEAAVDRGVERFLQDFLKREYPEDYKRTEVETSIRPAGSGRINATTTGEAIFKTGPAEDTALRDGLAEYLASGGDTVLADFLSTTGLADIQNLALDGVPVVDRPPEKSDDSKSSRNNTGAIIGGVVGGIAACLLCCWLASCFVTNRRDEDGGNANEVAEVAEEGKDRVGG